MAQTSRAWVMEVAPGWRVAVSSGLVAEYLVASDTIAVPGTARHCAGLLVWRERLIPVIDLAALLLQGETTRSRRAAILAYQEAPAEPLRYGALLVSGVPTEIVVSDGMAGTLSELPEIFRYVARACIKHDTLIPIVDTCRLFTRPLPLRAPFHQPEQESGQQEQEDIGVAERPCAFAMVEPIGEWCVSSEASASEVRSEEFRGGDYP